MTLPLLDIRIARRTAEVLGMPGLCRRRACRRTGRCAAPVSAEGMPRCVDGLPACDCELFEFQRELAVDCATNFAGWKVIPPMPNDEAEFALAFAMEAVVLALKEDPAKRGLLRAWLRRVRVPRKVRPPGEIGDLYESFGRKKAPDDEPAERV